MRRLSLSTKLFAAVIPLLLALGALLTLTVREGFSEVESARLGAQLGSTWEPLINTMRVIENEQAASRSTERSRVVESRRATNEQMVLMSAALLDIADGRPLVTQLGETLTALGLAREAVDSPSQAAARGVTAVDSYNAAEANLVAVGRLLSSQAGETRLARDLTAVAALAEIEQRSGALSGWISNNLSTVPSPVEVNRALQHADQATTAIAQFAAVAPGGGIERFRAIGLQRALNDVRRVIQRLDGPDATRLGRGVLDTLAGPVVAVAELRDDLALEVVADSTTNADAIAQRTWLRVISIAVAVFAAAVLALVITRSITRRVKAVSRAAHEVSSASLPALVEALHDPRGRAALPNVQPIDERGSDELAELAASFNALQTTLGDVATEQVEVLRRGVSDIFVTMARRNRSLVDRQLALLDELEASVTDHEVLSNYYQLDHLATRMRRNSESLLVLADAESARRRMAVAPIDDVVRAAIGEVEDYLRVDVLRLDPVRVGGPHVADLAHLLAELLDNATACSPPDSRVRIEGGLVDDRYEVTITDEGVGMERSKLRELNDLLTSPPVVGLSVEPTLGMSVVSLLAAKHGFTVRLARRDDEDGIIAQVLVPLSAIDGAHAPAPTPAPPVMPEQPAAEPVSATIAALSLTGALVTDHIDEPSIEELVAALDDDQKQRPAAPVAPAAPAALLADRGAAAPRDPLRLELPMDLLARLGEDSSLDGDSDDVDVDVDVDVDPDPTPAHGIPNMLTAPPASATPVAEMPPPGAAPRRGEFDRQPVPPVFANGPIARPVVATPSTPLPSRKLALPPRAEQPDQAPERTPAGLPQRNRSTSPGEPQPETTRTNTSVVASTTPPSALGAALAAFDAGRTGNHRTKNDNTPEDPR